MNDSPKALIVGQSLQQLGLPPDPFAAAMREGNWWRFRLFGITLYCYNFSWRRKAIAFHDLHHVVTGYACTMEGEMQVATWEFAAGFYPNVFAKLFCLPLVTMGAVLIPHKQFTAWKCGLRSKSLFTMNIDSNVVNIPTASLRSLTVNHEVPQMAWREVLGYAALVGVSVLLCILPVIAVLAAFLL